MVDDEARVGRTSGRQQVARPLPKQSVEEPEGHLDPRKRDAEPRGLESLLTTIELV